MSYTVMVEIQAAPVVYTSIGEHNAMMDAASNLPAMPGISLRVQS
ncbi:hypothetical protein [Undibacterium sp.]|jgi:hypothetical protein|nr:hypothetical protein [Undibacterium sp.]HTD03667.1 hypothetical protein [Undibacterium sp.]